MQAYMTTAMPASWIVNLFIKNVRPYADTIIPPMEATSDTMDDSSSRPIYIKKLLALKYTVSLNIY